MIFNLAGFALLKQWEGCKLTRYTDLAGVSTIGYGHTGPLPQLAIVRAWGAYPETIPQEVADWLLVYDVNLFADGVVPLVDDATDNQFSAMVSLAYNIGLGTFKGSSVLRLHRSGDFDGAAKAFLLWDKAHVNGQPVTVKGLLNRRKAESALYLKEA